MNYITKSAKNDEFFDEKKVDGINLELSTICREITSSLIRFCY